jgi:hypothetical protein
MDLAIHIFLEDFQDIATLSSIKIYPPMNFKLLVSNIQFALPYLFSIAK